MSPAIATEDHPGLEMHPLTRADLPEMAAVQELCSKSVSLLRNWRGTATDEGARIFFRQMHEPRFDMPNYTGFKVVESDTKEMVAFAGLTGPAILTPEQMAIIQVSRPWLEVEGWNTSIARVFQEDIMPLTDSYGYDPTQHFHRSMIMVRPDHQRSGIGRWLTRACNEVADKAGAVTYVRAMANATTMLQKEDFKILHSKEIDFSKYGGEGVERVAGLRREPATLV